MITMPSVDVFFFDVDHDHVQTLDKIHDGNANGHSWSIITPYLAGTFTLAKQYLDNL